MTTSMTANEVRQKLGLRPFNEFRDAMMNGDEFKEHRERKRTALGPIGYAKSLRRATGRTTQIVCDICAAVSTGEMVVLGGPVDRQVFLLNYARRSAIRLGLDPLLIGAGPYYYPCDVVPSERRRIFWDHGQPWHRPFSAVNPPFFVPREVLSLLASYGHPFPWPIEEQEAYGQRSFVASDCLPAEGIVDNEEVTDALESMGVAIGRRVDGDPLFVACQLPPEWKRVATVHV